MDGLVFYDEFGGLKNYFIVGSYRFTDVEVGGTCILEVHSKKYFLRQPDANRDGQ